MRNKWSGVFWAAAFLALFGRAGAADSSPKTVDEIALVVDQDAMTRGEMEEAIADLFVAQGLKPPAAGSREYEEAKKEVVDGFIREVLLAEEADRQKVEISDGEVDRQVDQELDNMKKRFASDAEFEEDLKKEGISEDDLRSYLHDNLLRRMKANRVLQIKQHDLPGSVFISDEEVKNYFSQHPEDYEQARFSIILFRIPPKSKPAYVAEVEKQADGVLADLKGGADFAAQAKKYSEDPSSAQNGGDVGTHYRLDLDPELAKGVFALPDNGLGIVKTPDGVYVVKLEHKGTADYDTVAPDIKQHLLKQKQDDALNQWLDGLRKNAYIVVDGKVIDYKESVPEFQPAPAAAPTPAPASNAAQTETAAMEPTTVSGAQTPSSPNAPATAAEAESSGGSAGGTLYPTLPEGGGVAMEIFAQGFSFQHQDLSDFYGPAVNTNQGFPFGAGFHLGVDIALDPTLLLGLKAEALRKFTETVNFSPSNESSYADQWGSGTAGGALEAKLLIPLDESTNFIIHAAGGYYFLLGASVTETGASVTENANFSAANIGGDAGGSIEFFLDEGKSTSLDLDVSYRYLKFQPVTPKLTVNNNGNLPASQLSSSTLTDSDGSPGEIDFSGVQVGIGVRFYLDKEGS